jgi:acyl-CoA dehydrogenase
MSSDLEDLRALVADIMTRQPPTDWEALWGTLGELGLTTIGIAEEDGGAGGGLAELATVVDELAAHGANVPLIEFNTGRWAHQGTGEVAIGVAKTAGGTVTGVGWARSASHLLLLVDGEERPRLVALDAPGVTVASGADPLAEHGDRVELRDAECPALQSGPTADEILTRLGVLRAAALVGATRGAYLMTRQYLREREQFGRPLVRIPSVATALAAIRVDVIQAETALDLALTRSTEDGPGALSAAATARVVAGQAATATARAAHQLHGAMGVTQEYPLHRLTKNLWSWRDAEIPELGWADRLGKLATEGGEDFVWSVLTATPASVA